MRVLDSFSRAVVKRRSPVTKVLLLALMLAIAALVRLAAGGEPYGPMITFFPAILLLAVFLGWEWALAGSFLSLLLVRFVIYADVALAYSRPGLAMSLLTALTFATMIAFGHLLRQSIIELDGQARRSEAFNAELQHRTKNTLQLVRALARRASRETDPAAFYEKLGGRLSALATANELLRFGAVESCPTGELIAAAMKPFAAEQIVMEGPECRVSKDAVVPLMMALHELGTNATKYGGLASESGRVEIRWRPIRDRIRLQWMERGGPEVVPPTRKGLGTRLLAAHGALTVVEVDYEPQGVVCRIEACRALSA